MIIVSCAQEAGLISSKRNRKVQRATDKNLYSLRSKIRFKNLKKMAEEAIRYAKNTRSDKAMLYLRAF